MQRFMSQPAIAVSILSLQLELITDPTLLFLDEPTSDECCMQQYWRLPAT
jgi:hypothetical protein